MPSQYHHYPRYHYGPLSKKHMTGADSISSSSSSASVPPPTMMSLRQLTAAGAKYKYRASFAPPRPNSNKNNNNNTKRVRFDSTATVCPGGYITPEECEQVWYKSSDYADFDRERRTTIHAVSQVKGDLKYLDPRKYCIRGLEQHLTRKQHMERRFNSMKYKEAVLQHQYYQKHVAGASQCDPEYLQRLSQMYSVQSSKRAYMRAVIEHALAA